MKFFGTIVVLCLALAAVVLTMRGALAAEQRPPGEDTAELCYTSGDPDACAATRELERRSAPRVTVTPPPYNGPPPIGWVYGPYTRCGNPPICSMGMVSVGADGLNVRATPNGPPVMALVNGTLLYPVTREGQWILVAAACDLTPTFAWSWTAGVPLNRCWIYY